VSAFTLIGLHVGSLMRDSARDTLSLVGSYRHGGHTLTEPGLDAGEARFAFPTAPVAQASAGMVWRGILISYRKISC